MSTWSTTTGHHQRRGVAADRDDAWQAAVDAAVALAYLPGSDTAIRLVVEGETALLSPALDDQGRPDWAGTLVAAQALLELIEHETRASSTRT